MLMLYFFEFRKLFYVSSCFFTVKKFLRTVLNQNSYRNFRLDPSHVPFQNIFIDYLGPIMIKIKGEKCKAYVLLFTCLFSRAINLQICLDLTEVNFLRAFQLHVFKYGFPSLCLSDRGSQICSGAKVIEEHISDKATQEYLNANGIKHTEFSQYAKGCKKLGGLVETCVKMVKRLIFGSIRKYIPSYSDFEYVIAEVNHIVNKRPVCFKEGLRDNDPNNEIPTAITPEMIINGRELVSLNVIPDLGKELDDWSADIKTNDMYDNVIKIRLSLIKIFSNEILPKLIDQSTDIPGRYAFKNHQKLLPGDIVLIKEDLIKRANLPMGIVKCVTKNSIGEVTTASVLKGDTREVVVRHVTSLIPYLETRNYVDTANKDVQGSHEKSTKSKSKISRKAALECRKKLKTLNEENLI